MRATAGGRRRRVAAFAVVALLLGTSGGCATIGYYGQAALGQARVLLGRRDVEAVLADPTTAAPLRDALRTTREVLAFAEADLGLPVGGRYGDYVELGRDAVVWNLVAAPRDRLVPVRWCYPIAGCVSYRGYFREAAAREAAKAMVADGFDVHVGGVAAYSTLGWFDDPLLSTFIERPPAALAELLVHELVHGLLYVPGETAFNESFATFYAREGVRRWLASGEPERLAAWSLDNDRRGRFVAAALEARERLAEGYAAARAEGLEGEAFEARRSELWAALRERWRSTRADDLAPWDAFFLGPPSNARLAAVADYNVHLPAFAALLDELDGDLARFRRAVLALADDGEARRAFLAATDDATDQATNRAPDDPADRAETQSTK